MKKQILATCILGALALPASAEGIYIFGDIGQTTIDADSVKLTDNTFSIGGGFKINDTFSIEAAYRDLGGEDSFFGSGPNFTAIQSSVLANLPINEEASVYGRLGVARLKITIKDDFDNYTDTDNKLAAGIGARYSINETTGFRVEYSRYSRWEEINLSTLTIGFDHSF